MSVVLYSHLPDEGIFRSERFWVEPIRCEDELDYWRGWQSWWDTPHTLCGIEHDMERSDDLIAELLDCPHPLCTHAYLLHMPSTGGRAHYAQRLGAKPPAGGDWLTGGESWATFTGIGFCKLTAKARVRPLEQREWATLDCAISKATDARWHVHWRRGPDGPTGIDHFHH